MFVREGEKKKREGERERKWRVVVGSGFAEGQRDSDAAGGKSSLNFPLAAGREPIQSWLSNVCTHTN